MDPVKSPAESTGKPPLRRVAVIGCCGAGKSTFAKQLSELTGLPVFHLDRIYLQENWVMKPVEQAKAEASKVHLQPEWIIDGNYTSSMGDRLDHADAVVFLDYSTRVCFMRVIRRTLKGLGTNRPDVAEGCRERFNIPFLLYVLNFRKANRPRIVEILGAHPDLPVYQPSTPEEAGTVLQDITTRFGLKK